MGFLEIVVICRFGASQRCQLFYKKKKNKHRYMWRIYNLLFDNFFWFLSFFPFVTLLSLFWYVNNCKGGLSPVISCRIFSFVMWIANNSNIVMKFIGCSNTRVFHTGREIITRYIYYQTSAIISNNLTSPLPLTEEQSRVPFIKSPCITPENVKSPYRLYPFPKYDYVATTWGFRVQSGNQNI